MGDGEDRTTAAARLRLLQQEFTTPAVRRDLSPPSHSPHHGPPPALVNLDILDHMVACRDEVITHTRTTAPAAGPAPAEQGAVYEWMHEHTADAAPEQQMVRDAMVFRQSLEHALEMNDETVIRRESCPRCACWSLFWRHTTRVAACVNRGCVDRRGRPSTWTLAQIAERHIAARNARSRTAT